jgi:hypothetical protein
MQDRRGFLSGAFALVASGAATAAFGPRAARASDPGAVSASPNVDPASALGRALAASPYVYVSPLKRDGSESRCHGEVWFAWIDAQVVLITARDRWKARSLARGQDRARIWVGDIGRVKGLFGASDAFRKLPHFDATASQSGDSALLDRLLARYAQKYPDEIGEWAPRMRSGFGDGSRVLICYRPVALGPPA